MTFDKLIKAKRLERGLTQVKAALAIGIEHNHLSMTERDDSRPGLIAGVKIAIFYGIPMENIYYD